MKLFFLKIIAYLKATWKRFNTESPKYWVQLQKFFNWLIGVTFTASDYGQYIIVKLTGYGLDVPPLFTLIMGHITTAAILARIVSGFPIKREAVAPSTYEKLNDPASTIPKQP